MLVYSLMCTVAPTVDTLVVVDAPESTLYNQHRSKKKLKNGVCISMGLQFSIEIVLFYVINPLTQHSKSHTAMSCNNEFAWEKENFGAGG